MALAWSQGDGFDDPRTWAAAATALGTDTYSERDVTRLLLDTTAIDLLHRTERGSGVRFRLFHEALGEHLRQLSARQRPPAEIHRRLTEVLLERLSPTSAEGLLWADADAYTRTYLPFHAAEGQVLDRLLRDARFLAAMDPARLLAALPAASTPSGRRAARTVQRVGQQLLMASEDERVCYLEMAARMAGDEELAASLAAAFPDRPWAVRWAHWDDLVATRMLGHHDDYVLALATVEHPRGPWCSRQAHGLSRHGFSGTARRWRPECTNPNRPSSTWLRSCRVTASPSSRCTRTVVCCVRCRTRPAARLFSRISVPCMVFGPSSSGATPQSRPSARRESSRFCPPSTAGCWIFPALFSENRNEYSRWAMRAIDV